MPLLEDPVILSKSGLRSDLVSHSVERPTAASRKLILKHKHMRKAADFSSDEEDQVQDEAEDKNPKDAKSLDPSNLTDDGLKAMLLKHGVKPGPIVASTRALYERKLLKLLQSDGCEELNEAENAVLYSDSEDSEKQEEEDKASDSEQDQQETTEVSEKTKPQGSKMEIRHSLSASSDKESNSSSTLEQRSRSIRVKDKYRLVDQSQYYTPESSPHRQKTKQHVEDILKDLFPDTKTTPTGIYATPRRPIKGAAQRPIQYAYPDTPVSPVTQERLEVNRRLVPICIQILVFFLVVCILYFIYVNVGDSSSVLALLDSLNQWPDSQGGVLSQAETQDSQSISGQD